MVYPFYEQLKENERLGGLHAHAAAARAEEEAEIVEKKTEAMEATVEEGSG